MKKLKKMESNMGIFSSYEDDAIREINKINSKMQAIRKLLVLYGDSINRNNVHEIKDLITSCADCAKKYERYKEKMDSFELTMFYGAKVMCWNGETVTTFQWEQYFENIFNAIVNNIKAIS
jgi:hypothetical protein